MKLLAIIVLSLALSLNCATTADSKKQCLESLAVNQALVTAQEIEACVGDRACIEGVVKSRSLIAIEYAGQCK